MFFRLGALPFLIAGLWSAGDATPANPTSGTAAEVSHEDIGTMVKNLEMLVQKQQARILDLKSKAEPLPHSGRSLLPRSATVGHAYWPVGEWYQVLSLGDRIITESLWVMWQLMCAFLVVIGLAGFVLAEAGSCRLRNVQNIILKGMTGVTLAAVGWWIFGWSFAFSGPWEVKNGQLFKESRFAGKLEFAGHNFLKEDANGNQAPDVMKVLNSQITRWFFEWACCSFAVVIAGSGVAERIGFAGHFVFSFLFASFVYPCVVAATWGGGFLADMNDSGFQDFAGSGVIHMTGGAAALFGAIIAGPRTGRWEGLSAKERMGDPPPEFLPHSVPLVVLGTFMMWFGWYGLNGMRVSAGMTSFWMDHEKGLLAAQVFMNSTIAAVTGGGTLFLLRRALRKQFDVTGCCSGILAGLVSISASAASVEVGSACAIGAAGAVVCFLFSTIMRAAKVDDPMDAIAIFLGGGWWGLFAETLFDWGASFDNFHGSHGFRCTKNWNGVGCRTGMMEEVSAANWSEMGFILAWSGGISAILFLVLRLAKQVTPKEDYQNQGYDDAWHDPVVAYDLEDIMPKTSL